MEMKSNGTKADIAAEVDISKVLGGYFDNQDNIDAFIKLGIAPVVKTFSAAIQYADFGGGQGQLAGGVKKYLESVGIQVNTCVVDANENYLAVARINGLQTKLCNLEECGLRGLDLITMRAVLHYNDQETQKNILKNIFDSLKVGGYLVHQNSSGNKENCELRSLIVNIPELGRAGDDNYCYVHEEEYLALLNEVGFMNSKHVGCAPQNAWSPEEQWGRFNSALIRKATEEINIQLLTDINLRKTAYLQKAYDLIKTFIDKYSKEYLGIKENNDGTMVIEYSYPIVVSRK